MPRDSRLWRVPRLWPGGECFILGGGPSLKDVDMSRLKGRRVIAVNNAFKLADWIDVMFFGDPRWLKNQGIKLGILNFAGLKVTTREEHLDKPWIRVVKRRVQPTGGVSRDPGILVWNISSGACAIGLAYHFGVKRIVLLGFDMRKVDGKTNWHDDYAVPKKFQFNPYSRFMKPFEGIAKDLKRLNVECLNATPGSALDVFPIVELEDVIR